MLAYAFLPTCDRALVRSCVAVGAPSIAVVRSKFHDLAMKGIWILPYIPVIPYRLLSGLAAPFAAWIRKPIERVLGSFLYNPSNMTDEALSTLMGNAVENLPPSLILEIAEAYRTKHYRNWYGTFSIRDNLHRIEQPLLVVAGSLDALTPPDDLKFVFDHVSSTDKEFVIVGRESGASADYGHVDLILGKDAPRDVFPLIQGWIERHERPEEAGDEDEATADELAAERRKRAGAA
jgi:pimeloyl-ACP methyl ester carboxylesterase